MQIENIVSVDIALGSQSVNVPGFGVALILSSTYPFGDRVRSYDSITAVGDDFAPTDPEYLAAQLYFSQAQKPTNVLIGKKGSLETWVQAIDAVSAVNDNWYALVALDHTSADVQLIAAHIEALKKIYITSSSDATILTSGTSDIAYILKQLNYTRTAVLYSAAAADYPEAGWLGAVLPLGVGNSTWKFKTIVGIASDNLTDTQFSFAKGKNANVYVPVAGLDITSEGVMAGGQFIDITRGVDALQANMEAAVFQLLVDEPKVPYTNKGISQIEGIMRGILQAFVDNGFLADKSYSVTAPDVQHISKADKKDRVLNGLEFAATLSGAIHKVVIDGFLSF